MSNEDSTGRMLARKNDIPPEYKVTNYIKEKYGKVIETIIGQITTGLIYTTDHEKYLSSVKEKVNMLRYDNITIMYMKNGELEITCIRKMRAELPASKSEAEMFILHIKQGSDEKANITIEAKGPSTTYNKDLLLENVKKYAYPLNEIVTAANEMYKTLTQPPVAVAPVVVAPPKPTNANTPAPGSVAARIALLNKKGGRRSHRKTHKKSRKSHKKSRKSRKSHKKSRKSQRRQ